MEAGRGKVHHSATCLRVVAAEYTAAHCTRLAVTPGRSKGFQGSGRKLAGMRLQLRILAAAALLLAPLASRAVSCTSQAELGSLDRDALTTIAGRLASAVMGQDYATLQAELLPEEASQWDGIRAAVDQGAAAGEGRTVSIAQRVSAGRERPDGTAEYAVLLLELDGIAYRDHQHERTAAGALRRGDRRRCRRAAGRANGAGSGVGWDGNRVEAGRIDDQAGSLRRTRWRVVLGTRATIGQA